MNKKLLLKLGVPFFALSLVAACGTDDDQDPVENEAPLEQEEEAPLDDGNVDPNDPEEGVEGELEEEIDELDGQDQENQSEEDTTPDTDDQLDTE